MRKIILCDLIPIPAASLKSGVFNCLDTGFRRKRLFIPASISTRVKKNHISLIATGTVAWFKKRARDLTLFDLLR
jgi:hypothetical protein